MAHIYLYEELQEFLPQDVDSCKEDTEVEPSEPEDYLAEWRYIVDL